MKILVIGASGLIAKPVIKQLDEAGFDLRLFSRSVKASQFDKTYEIFRGDVKKDGPLKEALRGCDAVHLTTNQINEAQIVKRILDMPEGQSLKAFSMVSGASASEENTWFEATAWKIEAEKLLAASGIPYYIFRPSWFFESLTLMVRGGQAVILGDLQQPYYFVAGEDFGKMVAKALAAPEKANQIYYVYGPKAYRAKELLERYCREFHPKIRKVRQVPVPLFRFLAFLSGSKKLKAAGALFAYFEKVPEPSIAEDQLALLGRPEMDFEAWVKAVR